MSNGVLTKENIYQMYEKGDGQEAMGEILNSTIGTSLVKGKDPKRKPTKKRESTRKSTKKSTTKRKVVENSNIEEYIPGTILEEDEQDMIYLLNEICDIRENEQKVANQARKDTLTEIKNKIKEQKKGLYNLSKDLLNIKKRDEERNEIKIELDNKLKNDEYKNENKRKNAKKEYLQKIKSLNIRYKLLTDIENETYKELRKLKNDNALYKMQELSNLLTNIKSNYNTEKSNGTDGYDKQEWSDFVSSFIKYYKNTHDPSCKKLLKANYESLYRYLQDSSNRNIFQPGLFGGAKKKSTTKRKSTKKSTSKKKSTTKRKSTKKSTKKSTTKKVSDKRLGVYKHKGHTHRTKKALKACTK